MMKLQDMLLITKGWSSLTFTYYSGREISWMGYILNCFYSHFLLFSPLPSPHPFLLSSPLFPCLVFLLSFLFTLYSYIFRYDHASVSFPLLKIRNCVCQGIRSETWASLMVTAAFCWHKQDWDFISQAKICVKYRVNMNEELRKKRKLLFKMLQLL